MIRGILSLTLVLLASADFCALQSGAVVTEGINSALFIWASTKRCKPGSAELTQAPVMCAQDLASTVQSVSALGSAIASMVGGCSDSMKGNRCGIAATDLVSATAGLTANVARVTQKCNNAAVPATLEASTHNYDLATELGFCTTNAGSSMDSIFDASNILQDMKKQCDGGASTSCTVDALDAVSVLSAFGAYIAEAVGHCETAHKAVTTPQSKEALCVGGILGTIADLGSVANLGLVLKHECASSKARLYIENGKVSTATGSPLVLALAAVLPLTAVLSFVAGKRFAKGQQPHESRNVMPGLLEEGSEE